MAFASIEVEVPEEAVVVITDGRKVADYQPAATTCVGLAIEVCVLPLNAVVLFVHADNLVKLHGVAHVVVNEPIEVVNHPEAVATEREWVRIATKQVFARVEIANPVPCFVDIAVWHDHFGNTGAGNH